MTDSTQREIRTRRLLLGGGVTVPVILAACALSANAQEGPDAAPAEPELGAAGTSTAAIEPAPASELLAATPECVDDDDVTPAQTEGPYFTPNSPERVSLIESGMRGTRLLVTGRVLSTAC